MRQAAVHPAARCPSTGGPQRTGLESIPDARSAFRPPSDKRPARHKTIISVKYTIMTKPEQR